MTKLDEQISTAEEKFRQFKLRQQRMAEKQKAAAGERERKVEMRRKVLVGGVVLAKVREGEIPEDQLRAWMRGALIRADDRALFKLDGPAPDSVPEPAPEPESELVESDPKSASVSEVPAR